MNPMPKISVIVPIYKTEKYLRRCVESIINQTYSNLEIILINDGSPDGSLKICRDISEKDNRVIVIDQENKGQSSARNVGIEQATGSYIGFVDSDDWLDPEMYEIMLRAMLDLKQEMVECNIVIRYEDKEPKIKETTGILVEDRLAALKRIIAKQDFSVCSRLYSKNILAGHRFREGTFAEDVYFIIDLVLKSDKLIVLSDSFYNYYKANESTTRGPYKLRTLGTIDAALYVEKNINDKVKNYDSELDQIVKNFILTILLYNYKSIHFHRYLDKKLKHRNKIRTLIKNYAGSRNTNPQFLLAKFVPIKWYNGILRMNSFLRH
jgi:glycosyltransferase involved in cell wall biosynthesis